jgi:hypothetical protein
MFVRFGQILLVVQHLSPLNNWWWHYLSWSGISPGQEQRWRWLTTGS